MKINSKIKQICKAKDMKIADLAVIHGAEPNSFYVKLCRNTMSFSEVEKIMDELDCDIVFVDRKSKKVY